MGTKEDIIEAARGTASESFIRSAMAAHPNLNYNYTDGLSRIDRATNTLLINSSAFGNGLVGAATHELTHLFTYNQYMAEAKTAMQTGDYHAMVAAMVNNEARTVAIAIGIAPLSTFPSGYVTPDQAAQAMMTAAANVGNSDSPEYKNELAKQLALHIRDNSAVILVMEKLVSKYFQETYKDTREFPPPPPIMPPKSEEISPDDAADYYDDYAEEWHGGGNTEPFSELEDFTGQWDDYADQYADDGSGDGAEEDEGEGDDGESWLDGPPPEDNDFFPSAEALAEDVPDIFDLETPNPTIDVKVYLNGQLHFDGGCSSNVIVPPIYWSDGTKIRYTIFVGGQLFSDEDHDAYVDPYRIAQRAVFADAAGLNGPNWASAATPSWFLRVASSSQSIGGSLDELSFEGSPPAQQLPAFELTGATEYASVQLVQAMSLFGNRAAGDGLQVSEPLTKRPMVYAIDI